MEVYEIAKKIEGRIDLLAKMRIEIRERAERKAKTAAAYDKALAVTMIRLKNGEEFDIDGNLVSKVPTTYMEKVARGICHKEKLEMDEAEALYKSLISNIDSVQSEMNAYQSINRHLDKL